MLVNSFISMLLQIIEWGAIVRAGSKDLILKNNIKEDLKVNNTIVMIQKGWYRGHQSSNILIGQIGLKVT